MGPYAIDVWDGVAITDFDVARFPDPEPVEGLTAVGAEHVQPS